MNRASPSHIIARRRLDRAGAIWIYIDGWDRGRLWGQHDAGVIEACQGREVDGEAVYAVQYAIPRKVRDAGRVAWFGRRDAA